MNDVLDELEGTILEGMTFKKAGNAISNQEIRNHLYLCLTLLMMSRRCTQSLRMEFLSLEEMMEKLSLSFSVLSSTLSMMEINGILGRADGKFEIK